MQNAYCSHGGSYEKFGADIGTYRKIIPNVRSIIDACHELNVPVFYTQQVREPSGIDLLTRRHHIIPRRRQEFLEKHLACVIGTWDAAIIDELMPTEDDHVVIKRRDSAFQDTELRLWLESVGADSIIFTGVDTCICVENSLREGFNKGFDVILVSDATASSWPTLHEATLEKAGGSFGLVLNTDQLIHILRTSRNNGGTFTLAEENLL
jgi:ureidoacrylate peracid hydrolase